MTMPCSIWQDAPLSSARAKPCKGIARQSNRARKVFNARMAGNLVFPASSNKVAAQVAQRFHADHSAQPAQQDNCFTSLAKVCAHSFNPSTMVR